MTRHARWIVLLAVLAASAVLPAEASAQRRAVRRPAVRSVVYVSARPYYRPYYYSPFFYSGYPGWYSGFGWYPSPYYGYGFYGPPYRYYDYYTSSARLQVKPRHAEVFIDGYFVGTVDDFDGWSQRLNVEPGEHQLEIYLPGHRSYRQPVLFRPGATIKIDHVMQPLAGGEQEESRPEPSQAPVRPRPQPQYRRGDPGQPPPSRATPPPQAGAESRDYGAIVIRVQPADAEVVVDGDRWDSPAGDVTLQLSEGTHRVEVRKSGYRSYSAEIRVRRGETTSVNVSLSRQN